MATTPEFRIHNDEPLALGVRRVILEQVVHATQIRDSDDLDTAVHDLRKAMKRTRAVLRLVRGELGDYRYRQENTALRDTSRLWGPTRDAAVLAKVAAEFVAEFEMDGAAADRVVTVLRARAAAATRAGHQDRRRHLDTLTALGSFACRVRRFPVEGPDSIANEWAAVQPGVTRVAKRAARRLRQAEQDPSVERLHAWRKDVKYLGYQLEVLRPLWKDLLGAIGDRLMEVGSILGDDHDLAVWEETLRADGSLVTDPAELTRLHDTIGVRRRRLQTEAFALGGTVLAEPKLLVEEVAAAWHQART
ncbi:CHAD domain-containing protein [Ornithinimicrobium ciconiae]|uniref:CHAD domain-containing protein n=1 Tax=Ornithinimicrobium ciconiae TaxID=2594265 RepID=UPI0013FD0881|nr:CHAD domain-containing protein [Ornithinimicrobium ciconiae]